MTGLIKAGEWAQGVDAQDKMLDEHARKYKLQEQDWRKQKSWDRPSE